MTAEELARLPDNGFQYELVRGVLHRMSPTNFEASNIAARLTVEIGIYVKALELGELTCGDGGYELESDPDTVLAPDVAFVRAERLPSAEERQQFPPLSPDLVVEVILPSDRLRAVNKKVDRYLATGVQMVWVFNPRRKTVTVRRPNQPARVLRVGDMLDGEEILPDFHLPVADVFR
jgi:Uma2 family endonuclease